MVNLSFSSFDLIDPKEKKNTKVADCGGQEGDQIGFTYEKGACMLNDKDVWTDYLLIFVTYFLLTLCSKWNITANTNFFWKQSVLFVPFIAKP